MKLGGKSFVVFLVYLVLWPTWPSSGVLGFLDFWSTCLSGMLGFLVYMVMWRIWLIVLLIGTGTEGVTWVRSGMELNARVFRMCLLERLKQCNGEFVSSFLGIYTTVCSRTKRATRRHISKTSVK